MKTTTNKSWLIRTTVLAGFAGALLAPAALAQEVDTVEPAAEAASEGRQETIIITGSRIAKMDFVSNSPIATVGAEQFELTGTVNTESLLNTLPQAIPGLDRTSNNPGNGTATVNLRGLGSGRTLVLVDGKRMVPTSGGGVVDINSIPTALVERVEVVTGGASAVYGSDAVAGVVNFVMKDDFEGVEANFGREITEQGDAGITSMNFTVGGNFQDDRGNAVLSLGYTNREALFQGDRDFASYAAWDDGAGGIVTGGSSGVPGTSIFSGNLGTFSPSSFGVIFNPDGTVRPFEDDLLAATNDYYNYAPVNYLQLPQERFQAMGKANYEINNHAEAYGSFVFAMNDVPQQLAATPIFQSGSQFSLDGNPYLTGNSQQVLSDAFGDGVDTDGDGIDDTATAFLRRRMLEVGPRISDDQFFAFQANLGVRGEIVDTWNYDISYQEGRVLNSSAQRGNVSRSRFLQALMLDDADGDGNVDLDANGQPSCADTGSNGATVGCSPLNIFGEGNISAGAAEFLRTAVNADARYNQRIFNANVAGDSSSFFSFQGGPIGMAFGMEYREEEFDFDPSQDLATGNIAGFNGAPGVSGSFDVYDYYGEAYLPFIKDKPGIDLLSLELAYRFSDYSTTGGVDAYKVAGEYAPISGLRFRTSFNTAVRAPNILELFSPQGEGFPTATDPCSALGADPASISAICVATGVPAGLVGSPSINLASNQVRQLSGGNPDLDPETAETFTIGAVWQPDFVEGLSVSVDYFDITITDAISSFGGGANNVLDTCYNDTAFGGAGSPFCNVISRRADGTIDYVAVTSQNVAEESLKGVDIQANYGFDIGRFGDIDLAYLATVTTESNFTAFEGASVDECAGEFGALICGEPIPEYKHRSTVGWSNGPFSAQLLWRYVGSVEDDDPGVDYYADSVDGMSYFDVSGSYAITDGLSVTGGIDNLLDEEPPLMGDNQEQANTYPATYDVFGRTFWVSLKTRF